MQATIKAFYDVGWGNHLTIRGEAPSLSWEKGQALHWNEKGFWERSFDCEADQPIEFKILINDQTWSIGSNYWIAANEKKSLFPFFKNQTGFLVADHYFDTPVMIYLPPSYHENPQKRYPVLYVHDGQNLFDPATSFGGQIWGVHHTIDRMVHHELMDEIISVGIYNRGTARLYDYTPSHDPLFAGVGAGGGADNYADFLINDIKPYVDKNYRTLPQRENTGLMGSSLGGLVSLYIGRKWSYIFSKVASLSSSFWWNRRRLLREIMRTREWIPLKIYLDAGTENDGLPETRAMYHALRECGYKDGDDLFCHVAPYHRHSEPYWRARLHLPLGFLFPPNSTRYN